MNRLDPLPADANANAASKDPGNRADTNPDAEPIDCGHRNGTDRMVIVRCVGADSFYLERVVFPFEVLSFSCPAGAKVEIWTHGLGGPELLESSPARSMVMLESEEGERRAGKAESALALGDSPWLAAS